MKKMKRFASLALALVMALALAVPAFAAGNATITVENASKGETYKLVKLFNASYNETTKAIVYTGNIPEDLTAYFVQEGGYIKATEAAMKDDALTPAAVEAITAWAKTQDGTEQEAEGGPLLFTGLDYGYYVVVSRSENTNGGAISVTSTMPNATIVDKNTNTLTKPEKKVTDGEGNVIQTADVGETVTYTVTFKTLNWIDKDDEAKQVISYTVADTLPNFLENVQVTEITVGGQAIDKQQFVNGSMSIQWAEKTNEVKCEDTSTGHTHGDGCYVWNSLYDNGAELKITYTAVVTDKILGAGEANHKNTVTVTPQTNDGPGEPKEDDEDLYTATIVIDKFTTKEGQTINLAGAKFILKNAADDTAKFYRVDETTKKVTWVEDKGQATVVTTDDNGSASFAGLKEGTYYLEETEAPAGYNKLTGDVTVEVTKPVDDNTGNPVVDLTGNISHTQRVENFTGATLPSTGGIGTTIFYLVGGILVAGAAIMLVTRKRVKEEQ